MIKYADLDADGYVVAISVVPTAQAPSGAYLLDDQQYDALRKRKAGGYVENGVLQICPQRPSLVHRWSRATKQWELDPDLQIEHHTSEARAQRNQLLETSDWTDTLSAQTRLGPKYAEWQSYRQALRDITDQPGFPLDIVWPTPPA